MTSHSKADGQVQSIGFRIPFYCALLAMILRNIDYGDNKSIDSTAGLSYNENTRDAYQIDVKGKETNMDSLQQLFIKRIRSLRKAKNKKQADVAEAIGVSAKTYSKWETGENEPNFSAISMLADYFEVSPAVFFAKEVISDTKTMIEAEFDGLNAAEAVDKAFELQFWSVRTLAEKALFSEEYENVTVEPPRNRVNPKNNHAITAFASREAYSMMYNGSDANISISVMPSEDRCSWLYSERDRLSEYLSLMGDPDMLCLLTYILSFGASERYSAGYLAEKAGIGTEKAVALLRRCASLEICDQCITQTGDKVTELYSSQPGGMLLGLLTIAHLSLPETEKNGCRYINTPISPMTINEAGCGNELR